MAMLDALPLLKLPSSWPLPVVATLCMAALAGPGPVRRLRRQGVGREAEHRGPRPRRAVVPRALLGLRVVAAVRRAGRRHHGLDRAAAGRHPASSTGSPSTAHCRPGSSPPSSSSSRRRGTCCWPRAAPPPETAPLTRRGVADRRSRPHPDAATPGPTRSRDGAVPLARLGSEEATMTSQHNQGRPRPHGRHGRSGRTAAQIALVERYAAHNYHPLPVVLTHGEGAWVTDVDGRRYLDCLAGYSALNFGHGHPRLRRPRPGAARPADPDQPRLPQRPARPVRRGPGRSHRQGPRPADEHRSRGRRDRPEGRPQVGLPRQGRSRRTPPASSSWRATSTGAPRPSSASATTRSRATSTAPTHRASAR